LHGVQSGKKKIAMGARFVAPDFPDRTQHGIDGGALGFIGLGFVNANVHLLL
jgi:hypothetical protein